MVKEQPAEERAAGKEVVRAALFVSHSEGRRIPSFKIWVPIYLLFPLHPREKPLLNHPSLLLPKARPQAKPWQNLPHSHGTGRCRGGGAGVTAGWQHSYRRLTDLKPTQQHGQWRRSTSLFCFDFNLSRGEHIFRGMNMANTLFQSLL